MMSITGFRDVLAALKKLSKFLRIPASITFPSLGGPTASLETGC